MIPITRIDEYLAVISQDEDATGLPDQAVTRIDTYLSKIAGEAVAELPEPVTRIDRYLASIAGMDVVMDDPITRIDYYLATVAGVYSGELPEPVTRIDHYLYNWASGGSLPWTTFTGNPLQFSAPKAHTLRSTTVEFAPKQSGSGDPSPDNVRPISGWTALDVFDEPDYDPSAQPMTTLTFPSTIYGGTASVAEDGSVELTIDRVCQTYDGTENITANTTYHYLQLPVTLKHPLNVSISEIGISSLYPFANSGAFDRLAISNLQTAFWLWPTADSPYYDNSTAFKAFLAEQYANGKPLQICYLLAEPQTIHLSSVEQLTALAGINTMWTDGDNLTVEARGEAVNLNALQSLNMLLGGRYYNNGTADEPTDEEALDILLGGHER